ncbi:YacP-like NYN domain containing protein [Nitzschia inconspicua]|uniref:YacP-like NYN domain containing protein n=1 Tax=Nitzschia inconspicua TaxID=303405 RepID=A0A9K3LDL9_9STRA|nr:YacP-like NYN domain containing protein [Nitzschia inconspicua]
MIDEVESRMLRMRRVKATLFATREVPTKSLLNSEKETTLRPSRGRRERNVVEKDVCTVRRRIKWEPLHVPGSRSQRTIRNFGLLVLSILCITSCFRFTPTEAFFTPSLSSATCLLHGTPISPRHSSSSGSSSPVLVMMGKGDGKKKRPKKNKSSPSASASSSPSPSMPQPQRVSTEINVPIRRQIAFGKINKMYRESLGGGTSSFRQSRNGGGGGGPAKPLRRTKYRKVLDEETIQQKALERQRKGQDPDWDVILNQTAADPIMFVDGYNIIHKWPRLKKHMAKGDLEKARRLLLDDLEQLASLKRWRIECVFDGGGNNRRQTNLGGGALVPTGKGKNAFQGAVSTSSSSPSDTMASKSVYNNQNTVRVVFTGRGVEADSYIESRCADAKNVTLGKTTSSLMVATDDAMIKMAALNAGALCMSADRFVLELKAVKKSMAYRVEAAMAAVNGHVMRPESLWGTNMLIESSNSNAPSKEIIEERADGTKMYIQRVGRGVFLVEDRREKNRKRLENKMKKLQEHKQGDEDENS